MTIPTEPIGSIPRPLRLIEAVASGDGTDPRLDALYDEAVRDTVARFEATGSPVITDGEQRKYHNFWTYSVEGLPNTAPDGFKIPFSAGHVRRMLRLTGGPFRYKTHADRYLDVALKVGENSVRAGVRADTASVEGACRSKGHRTVSLGRPPGASRRWVGCLASEGHWAFPPGPMCYPLGVGRTSSRMDCVGRARPSFSRSSSKQLRPVPSQPRTSSITLGSVNADRYRRSDSSTLVTIVCRRAPGTVLLVRPVLRALAGLRSVRSASLFVPPTVWISPLGCSTGLAVTKVNNSSASSSRITSLTSRR